MGQFLSIGFRQKLYFNKLNNVEYWDSTEQAVRDFECHFNLSMDVYDKREDEKGVMYSIKPDLLYMHLPALLKAFYAKRYANHPDKKEADAMVDEIERCNSPEELMTLLDGVNNLIMWRAPTYNFLTAPKFCHEVIVPVRFLALSFDGQIVMECVNGLFDYLASTIRDSLPLSPLREAIVVDIVG